MRTSIQNHGQGAHPFFTLNYDDVNAYTRKPFAETTEVERGRKS
jgi:hypothetical protein